VMQGWEGRVKVGMSNSVTTAIRGSLRDTEIGRSRNTDKADRATVEQVRSNCYTKIRRRFGSDHLSSVFCNVLMLFCSLLQALDPRTRMVLFRMLNRGVFNDVNGCISTGKEVCHIHYSHI